MGKAQTIRSQNPSRPVNTLRTVRNPLAGLVVCSHCGRKMIRRPYQKNEQPAMLICPYTDCPTVSSRLDLVEQAILHGLQEFLKLQSKSWCCPIQIRYTYQIPGGGCTETPECSQSSELPENQAIRTAGAGEIIPWTFFWSVSELLPNKSPPPLPLFLKLRKIWWLSGTGRIIPKTRCRNTDIYCPVTGIGTQNT